MFISCFKCFRFSYIRIKLTIYEKYISNTKNRVTNDIVLLQSDELSQKFEVFGIKVVLFLEELPVEELEYICDYLGVIFIFLLGDLHLAEVLYFIEEHNQLIVPHLILFDLLIDILKQDLSCLIYNILGFFDMERDYLPEVRILIQVHHLISNIYLS